MVDVGRAEEVASMSDAEASDLSSGAFYSSHASGAETDLEAEDRAGGGGNYSCSRPRWYASLPFRRRPGQGRSHWAFRFPPAVPSHKSPMHGTSVVRQGCSAAVAQ